MDFLWPFALMLLSARLRIGNDLRRMRPAHGRSDDRGTRTSAENCRDAARSLCFSRYGNSPQQPAWVNPFRRRQLRQVAGYVDRVNVEVGSRVKKGDVLIKLWVPELVQELKQKEVMIAQAKIEIDQAEKAVKVARARLETMTSLVVEARAGLKLTGAQTERWKSELQRMQNLANAKVLDEQTRDETLNQFRATEASMEEANAKVQTSLASQHESEANCEKVQADLEAAATITWNWPARDERRVSGDPCRIRKSGRRLMALLPAPRSHRPSVAALAGGQREERAPFGGRTDGQGARSQRTGNRRGTDQARNDGPNPHPRAERSRVHRHRRGVIVDAEFGAAHITHGG